MDKKRIIEILDEMGTLLELTGGNPFRARAYHNAAQVLRGLTDNIESLVYQESLTSIKGIGQGLADLITELVRTDKAKMHEELRVRVPSGVLDMLRIEGLGPKKIKNLYEKLNIKSIAELQDACDHQRLRSLEGFGVKSEESILKSIKQLEHTHDKHLYSQALESAEKILSMLVEIKGIKRSEYAGSLRRRKELIGDVDLLVSAAEKARPEIFKIFTSQKNVESVIAAGGTKASVILTNGIHCDLRIVNESEYPFALNYFTGSKEHNVEMRSLARKRGLSLNEYGFTKIEKATNHKSLKKIPSCKTEEDIYSCLGLYYIPPELRENTGEIEYAQKNQIPTLIELADLQGAFHCHTTDSDGLNTLEQMVSAAQHLGWKYLGIADHSQSASYAGGLSVEKARDQLNRINRLNKQLKNFRIFKGTECDILPDGSLDYSDELLKEYDYVVVAIHSKFKMIEDEATKRIRRALKNKYVTMLAHPTGRLLLEREGYPLNMPAVIQAAADYGKAIEINAHPMRLDLDWRFLKFAKEKGVRICINPDAHTIDGLKDVQYGVAIARKGWLEAKDVVNTWQTQQVDHYFGNK